MRRLGVDHGLSRVGLALSDEEGKIAQPHRTLRDKNLVALAQQVARAAHAAEAVEIVVGLPLSLDGSEGAAARRARRFAGLIEEQSKLRVILWDERFTTVEAERSLAHIGVQGKRRREVVDQVAAALMLQSYLDHSARTGGAWRDDDRGDRGPTES